MRREARKVVILGTIAMTLLATRSTHAGPGEFEATPVQVTIAVRCLDDLVNLTTPQLDQLYRQSGPGSVPCGKALGRALYPDSHHPKARSNAAKLAWQGKVFAPEASTAINRFFGVRAVKGNVYIAPSWLDGGPSLILDYEGTSWVYRKYRDEIREIAPGLYLGLMYDRTAAPPTLKMYFAFHAHSF